MDLTLAGVTGGATPGVMTSPTIKSVTVSLRFKGVVWLLNVQVMLLGAGIPVHVQEMFTLTPSVTTKASLVSLVVEALTVNNTANC